MARDVGPVSFVGTGSHSFNVGMTPTWMNVYIQRSGHQPMHAYIANGDQWCFSQNANPVNKAIEFRNSAGTIVLAGTWTSFSGTQANFNITTNTISGGQQALLVFGDN